MSTHTFWAAILISLVSFITGVVNSSDLLLIISSVYSAAALIIVGLK